MCGICGATGEGEALPIDERRLTAMRDALEHRGPDDAGNFLAPGVALGSRRLAVLDLSAAGHMPMQTEDGRYTIVYNGEIYNFSELRRELEGRGHAFRSTTDTEVLLKGYAEFGPAVLEKLNGMFAFAVWDARERSLFLARDRLGVKPLYYAEQGGTLYFASEEKALFAAGLTAAFDPSTWAELLLFRYVAGERTPFRGVKRLLPGRHLTWKCGIATVVRWWNLAERAAFVRAAPPSDYSAWFRATFDDSVRLRRIADVPIGVLLSGGLDSSSVAASLGGQGAEATATFTVRFRDAGYDEGPAAREVAEQWRLAYHELFLDDDVLLERLRECSWTHDEPLVHGNDPQLAAVSDFAKRHVTVLLSGEGADETLGGYVRYQPLRFPRALAAAKALGLPSARASSRFGKLGRYLRAASTDRLPMFNGCDVFPADLAALGISADGSLAYRESLAVEARNAYPDEPVRQAMYIDQHTYLTSLLDRNDRMTMGASIECRVPFLDYRLVEGLAACPTRRLFRGRKGKALLREALGDRLPRSILQGRKWGFGVPWERHLREHPELRRLVETLADLPPICDGPFDRKALTAMAAEFLAGDNRRQMLIRQLLLIAVWHESYFPRAAVLARS